MFYECDKLKTVIIDAAVNDIGEFAFAKTAVDKFIVQEGNITFKVQTANYVISSDCKTLIAVSPKISGAFSKNTIGGNEVTSIGKGAFSHNTSITSVNLPKVSYLDKYAMASSKGITSVSFAKLTNIGEYAFFETSITELPLFDSKEPSYASLDDTIKPS